MIDYKIVLTEQKPKNYPYIGEWVDDGGVVFVLFTSMNIGTVIYHTQPKRIGEYNCAWNENLFKPMEGILQLHNV